jgi:hypothetical protein
MKRKAQPPAPGPEPLDPANVRELIEQVAAAQARGEDGIHCHPAIYALDALCDSPMPGYYVVGMLGHPDGPRPIAPMVEHILRLAPDWAAQAARMRCLP